MARSRRPRGLRHVGLCEQLPDFLLGQDRAHDDGGLRDFQAARRVLEQVAAFFEEPEEQRGGA